MRREKKAGTIALAVILLFSILLTLGCGSSKSTSSSQSTNISQASNTTTTTVNNNATNTTQAISSFQGTVTGNWSGKAPSGAVSGTFTATIDTNGAIQFSLTGDYSGTLSGQVNTSGNFTATGTGIFGMPGLKLTWQGKLTKTTVTSSTQGTWSGTNRSGTFTGTEPVMAVATTITVGRGPAGIAYDSKMGEMFVANHDDNTVSVILDNNILDNKNAVVATVKVGTWPTSVAYDSGQGEIYVVSNVGGSISVIDENTNNVIATVTGLTYSPNDIVYDSAMKKLFVAESQNGSNNGAVDVIDDISHKVIKTIATKGADTVIVCDAAQGELFTPGDGQNIYAISDSTYDVTTIPLASYPGPAAYDPAKREIFVSLPIGETYTSGYSVITDSNNTVIKTITTSHPGDFAYNSVKGEMYAETANNTISLITDSGTTVVANLSSTSGPMACDTSEGKLYIINTNPQGPSVNTISVITPAS